MSHTPLSQRDRLLGLLRRIANSKSWLIYLMALGVNVVILLIPGILLSDFFSQKGVQFLSLRDNREWPINLFIYGFVSPLLWLFYEWQLRGLTFSVSKLRENGVLGQGRNGISSLSDFWVTEAKYFNHPLISFTPVVAVALGIVIYLANLNPQANAAFFGLIPWYAVNGWYFFGVFVPWVSIHFYMVFWIILRLFLVNHLFHKLYQSFQIEVRLFHADQCNGFYPLGGYILKVALIVVVFGLWVSAVITFPLFYGYYLNWKFDTILLLMIYIGAVPAAVVFSVWSTHRVMLHEKERKLNEVAGEIQIIFQNSEGIKIVEQKEILDALHTRYQMLQAGLKTWPFRTSVVGGFILTATTPLISTAISLLLENYISNLFQLKSP